MNLESQLQKTLSKLTECTELLALAILQWMVYSILCLMWGLLQTPMTLPVM